MAAWTWWRNVRPHFRGFSDLLTGLIIGAGVTKIYYETTGNVKENLSIKKQTQELIKAHDDLKLGSHLRRIEPRKRQDGDDYHADTDTGGGMYYNYGLPLRSPDHIRYTNHVLCYDQVKKNPRWVAEHLTRDKVNGHADREHSLFGPDPIIPEIFRSTNEDYLDSGWSRGHMAPAGDNKFNQHAMNDTFYLSNIVPQNYENNAGFWYRMEVYSRSLTKRYSDVYVVSGPLYLPKEDESGRKVVQYQVIGQHNVAVPTHLYKVILADDRWNPPVLGAFVVPNEPIGFEFKLQDFQVPLKDLEREAGLIFFPKYDVSTAPDLCERDGCKLLSEEFMKLITFGRKLRNAGSLQELEKVWEELKESKLTVDKFSIEIYEKKKEQLSSSGFSAVDGTKNGNTLQRRKDEKD